MKNWIKQGEQYQLIINSNFYRESDIPFSDFFSIIEDKIVFYDLFQKEILEEMINPEIKSYLLKKKALDCSIKLKKSLGFPIQKQMKLKE